VTVTAEAPASPPEAAPDSDSTVDPPVAQPPRPVPAALLPWHDPNPRLGWAITAFVTIIAGIVRLWDVGWPPGNQFDEVYYNTESKELLQFGYEDNRGYMFIVHPPLGKWLIAIPQWILNNPNEVAWRLGPAIAGIVAVLLITRIARRMFQSNLFGGIAGLLLALEGMSVVLSRLALLDIFLQVFILASFGALALDREQMRARLGRLIADGADLSDGVPSLGPRPWRLAAGVLLGLANGIKWTALAFFFAFILLSIFWDRGALKSAGVDRPWRVSIVKSWPYAIGSLIITPFLTYMFVWLGWFAGETSWGRHYANSHSSSTKLNLPFGIHIPFNWGWVPSGIRSLGAYHIDAYRFHQGLDSPHPYGSKPWSWLVLGRPVDVYFKCTPAATAGDCDTNGTVRHLLILGTPLMWWAFLPMLIWLAWHYATTRDWRAGSVWLMFLAGWVFWFQNLDRTMFLFYMAPLVPFLILGLTLALGTMLGRGVIAGPAVRSWGAARTYLSAERRRAWGSLAIATFLGLVIADFVWMWPIFTGSPESWSLWNMHMWLQSWV
jgi:dolichyl-phosphate-mannose--protein O-mannosyl transferase